MQTKIALDNELIERAQKLTGIKAKGEAVQEALRALVSLTKQDKPDQQDGVVQPQTEIIESLERSLTENAEIWSELAKR